MNASIGREHVIDGVAVAGIISCVPAHIVKNDQFNDVFGASAVADVVKLTGVQSRRQASVKTTTADLCQIAGSRLLNSLGWEPTSIGAIIFVSQTPDYRLPATACALQKGLEISNACIAFDINLGCSGYPYALWLGMNMIKSGAAKRVLLAVGDTISKVVDNKDRATALLFGDAGTVTALESSENASPATFVMGTDGIGVSNLIVPHGAYKTGSVALDKRFEGRDLDALYMDGGEIFNFTLRTVPPLVARTRELGELDQVEHDYYLFHQANLFMLNHLAKKAKLEAAKVPMNIEEFGNTSSASIPLLITSRLAERVRNESVKVALFGFGVGYSWASASLTIGPLKVAETIEYDDL